MSRDVSREISRVSFNFQVHLLHSPSFGPLLISSKWTYHLRRCYVPRFWDKNLIKARCHNPDEQFGPPIYTKPSPPPPTGIAIFFSPFTFVFVISRASERTKIGVRFERRTHFRFNTEGGIASTPAPPEFRLKLYAGKWQPCPLRAFR